MSNSREAEYCVHCGASLSNSPFAQGSDTVIYPRLAEANLLRMRGKFKEAEDICLSILHQFPHNLSANVLLGDIAVEKGDLDQGTEWYELALDIDPEAQSVQEKLDAVRNKRDEVITATTVEQLGLPTKRQRPIVLWVSVIAGILILGGLGYAAYRQTLHTNAATVDPNAPYIIPPNPPVPPVPPTPLPSEDEKLTSALQQDSDVGAFVTRVEYDPALNGITITYSSPKHKDERIFAATLTGKAFPAAKEVLKDDIDQVQLRALDGDNKLSYGAIIYRSDFEEAMKDEWQEAHKDDPLAFANAILKKEIFPTRENPKTTGSDETTGGEGGDQTGGGSGGSSATSGENSSGSAGGNAVQSASGSSSPSGGNSEAHTTGASGANSSTSGNPPGAAPNTGASAGG